MEFITGNITAIIILGVNLLASISYFLIYSKNFLKDIFLKLPMILQKIYVAIFVLPLFIAPFFSKSKFADFHFIYVLLGIIIIAIGLFIILLSFLKIGLVPSIKNNKKLSTTGMYKIVRHPIYFGTIVTQIGLILLNQAMTSLLYLPLSIMLYYIMASLEEKDLVNIFRNQYIYFRSKTKGKIIPFIL